MSYADNPIATLEQEWLSRESSVDTLVDVLSAENLETPLVVGIYGAWGSGKTSVMRLLREGLHKRLRDEEMERLGDRSGEHAFSLWFDAWKYARQDMALWRALLLAVVDALGDEKEGLAKLLQTDEEKRKLNEELERLGVSLYRSQTITEQGDLKVNWGAAVPFAADLALRIATLGLSDKLNFSELIGKLTGKDAKEAMQVVEREQTQRHREQVTSLEQFHKDLRALIEQHIVRPGRRLYLFVDDLDRCLPEDAVGALEAIKLFLDMPGCVFVLGMDRHVVEQGIRVRYKEFALAPGMPVVPVDPRQYLDKIIQVPFRLPPLSNQQMQEFVSRWCAQHEQGELERLGPIIVAGIAANPRSVKRALNVLRLVRSLESRRARLASAAQKMQSLDGAAEGYLAKLVVLQTSYDDLYAEIVRSPDFLCEIEDAARGRGGGNDTTDHFSRDNGERLKAMLALEPYFEAKNKDELRALVYLTEATG
jgi:hypothetical protein